MATFKQLVDSFILPLFMLVSFSTVLVSTLTKSEYLNIPMREFENSAYSTLNSVRGVASVISKLSNKNIHNFQLSNATADCLELLDSTQELLESSLSLVQQRGVACTKQQSCITATCKCNVHCKSGDVRSDLQTWLSSALTNQATCMDELVDTNHIAGDSIAATMDQITATIQGLLSMVQQVPPSASKSSFPPWFKPRVLQIIHANGTLINPNVTVAADGSGNFTTITQAIENSPMHSNQSYVIYIKKGTYNEYVEIKRNRPNIVLIGDGMNQTVISGEHSNNTGWSTFRSATFAVSGCRFIAINITFENRAGEGGNQAVALRSDADQSIFYQCEMRGYQDTLYAHCNRQFYRECRISGTVDFIFGDGAVVFQKCDILARQRQTGQDNTVTAQGRKYSNASTGFSFHLCNITGDSHLISSVNRTKTYFGRPWKPYARVVIMESTVSDVVEPKGWLPWNTSYESSVFLAEYNNNGPGSNVCERVKWPGVHVHIDKDTAANFTVSVFIRGASFIPSSYIPYVAELQS